MQDDGSLHQLLVAQGCDGDVRRLDWVEDEVVVDLVGEEDQVVSFAEVTQLLELGCSEDFAHL